MKLTSIGIENMKGQNANQALTGMDIFTGCNGAGKTTRLQAIAYGMLGYVPGGKKTPAETFKMATGNSMKVEITADTFAFARVLTKSRRRNVKTGEATISIKESLSLSPGAGERTDTEKELRIKSEMGDFPVMLDFGEFLAMSDSKRRDFIYSLSSIDSASWDKDRVHKYLVDALLTNDLQQNNQEQYAATAAFIAKTIKQYPSGYTVSDGLQAMLDWADNERRYWSAKQKDAQGAVRQISEQKNEIEDTERGINEQKKGLIALENALILFEKQASVNEEQLKAREKRDQRITEITGAINKIESLPPVDITGIDSQIATLRGKVQPVPDIGGKLKELFEQGKKIKQQIINLQQDRNAQNGTIATIKSTIQALDDAMAHVGKLEGRCVASAMIACPKNFSDPKLVAGIEKNKTAAAAKVAELQTQIDNITEQISVAEMKEETLSTSRATLEKSVSDTNSVNAKLNQEISKLTARKESAVKVQAGLESKLASYKDELERLNKENQPAAGEIEQIDQSPEAAQKASETRDKIEAVKVVIEQKEKARQALILVQQSMIENRQADYNATAMKLIYEKLGSKGAQGELVKEIIEPIRADIAANLRLMGFTEEPFFDTESDTGKEIFQFGWTNNHGHKVNFDALSAGQQTVFLAAMLVTIIDRKNPKTRLLIMDNLNHLDARNFQLIVDGLSKVKDKLDNIILAGAIEFEFAADGWQVWDLGKPVRSVEQSA